MTSQFQGHKYITLETFKKDGTGVKTPLWFVEKDGILYMRTPMNTWKVKRIRRNPRVRIVPSDVRGTPKGEWVSGTAEIHHESELPWVNDLVRQKYGWLKRLMDWRSRITGKQGNFAVIAVQLDGRPGNPSDA